MNIDTRIESSSPLFASLLFRLEEMQLKNNGREKKESSSGQRKREDEREEKQQIGYIFVPSSLNRSHLNLLSLWESFKRCGAHTSIFKLSQTKRERRRQWRRNCAIEQLRYTTRYIFLLCSLRFLFFGILLGQKVGCRWKKSAHRKALISSILQKYLPYHLTLFTWAKAHRMQNNG